MVKDEIFEEEIWEEEFDDDIDECAEEPEDSIDNQTMHIASLMQKAIDLCDEIESSINKIQEINDIFTECDIGLGKEVNQSLEQIKLYYSEFVPGVILGDDDKIIEATANMLKSTREISEAFIDDKRNKVLEKMEELSSK